MEKILAARDKRVLIIESLLLKRNVVISLRCNYPGLSKDNQYTRKVIKYINEIIVNEFSILSSIFLNDAEGPVYIYEIASQNGLAVKAKTVNIESNHPIGRLVDIDVYYETLESISRKALNMKSRKCFICEDNAFTCIVHKKHSEGDIIAYFNNRLECFEHVPLDIIEFTNQAMLYELFLTPSFGKVSPYSTGSHADMDHYTFIDSISVLNKYMLKFAYLGYQGKNIAKMYDEAIMIGKECEIEMFNKTNGINTHKGLIFVLGSLVVASSKIIYDNDDFQNVFSNVKILTSPKINELSGSNDNKLSNGEKIYKQYKIGGVRKEASSGFPIIRNCLNMIDLTDKLTLIKTFIYIMSQCDDTTIINRKGIAGLKYVKEKAIELFKNNLDEQSLMRVSDEFIKQGISPGGACDLLCGAIYLKLIQNYIDNKRRG